MGYSEDMAERVRELARTILAFSRRLTKKIACTRIDTINRKRIFHSVLLRGSDVYRTSSGCLDVAN